ncbi:MAG TPA: zf-HC2 domain-containing protein, partial [Longimicrobiales bacterium]|nr:zf-HC2 domain-containing protein [Longimicrobiales bacterium]
RLAALLPSPRPRHVSHDRLQDYVEGLLPARQLASVEAHLASCGACAAEADQWRTLLVRLSTLERLTPREGFAETVLARLSRPQAAPAAAREAAAGADWWQSLVRAGAAAAALVRRAVPRSRRAWAALAGVSVTPAVTLGLVLYTVFSHPSLTPSALVSFVVWKASALLAAGWATFVASASEVVRIAGLGPWVEALAGAPALVAAAVLAYAALFLLATRVLYKNLVSKNLIPGRRRVSVG